jgi:hypothetical protein
MDNWINLLPILVIAAGSIVSIVAKRWQISIITLGVIFISSFSITVQFWPFWFSLVKIITGLMSLVVIGLSLFKKEYTDLVIPRSTIIFRITGLIFLLFIALFSAKSVSDLLSSPLEIVLSALLIMITGIWQLGMTQRPLNVILAILTFFLGFELIYSANETSLLVNGLLAMVNLLIALVGSYILSSEVDVLAE